MVQAYHRQAAFGIYSLAGFATADGRVLARASRKVLQRPRKLGIGLCFEGVELKQDLLDKVTALCKELGYYGIFEIEFIEHEDDFLLIDFNPRPYSQMAFEVARDLPLPWLHYLTATGETDEFERAWQRAAQWKPTGEYAYCHETLLGLVIGAQAVSAVVRGEKSERWDKWVKERRPHLTDAVRSDSDIGPVLVDALRHGREAIRHPRSFLRSFTR
jgi:D-aspartate ligase